MKKILNLILIVLLAIVAVSTVLWIAGVFGPFDQDPNVFGGADILLTITYIYLAIAVLVLVAMTAMNMGKSRSNSKVGLYVFGACAVLGVIAYFAFASAAPVTDAGGTVYDKVFTLKITDTMLYLAYITLGGAALFMLGGEVWKALK